LVNVPLLLVGTKVDLRRQPGFVEELAKSFERMVTYEEVTIILFIEIGIRYG
jgi:hypothetical protein